MGRQIAVVGGGHGNEFHATEVQAFGAWSVHEPASPASAHCVPVVPSLQETLVFVDHLDERGYNVLS